MERADKNTHLHLEDAIANNALEGIVMPVDDEAFLAELLNKGLSSEERAQAINIRFNTPKS